ncbi:Cystathionine gamma-synthase [Pyrodictium delaneyi]|uniref:Cystathionine gamma-synthase n=1 Tax=Pyrodictium delaneyi TaxID=1273541 RepID=A0A0P0N1F1_9CREN|nr:aminotransferase class I/II-fold pyridoxal phosphate-dependent enzyme [Pyrodictium delaneyi]ALL00071.1 Cystathionine gamma-synthase [Pyrodictium delaneyi]OWJ54761.1 hypothetical protein Pdsh_03275 [Pyrodictium delaneyi]
MTRYNATGAIHSLRKPIEANDIIAPISISAIYRFIEVTTPPVEEIKYSRENNPTVLRLEEALAAAESAKWCLAFNTGMSAISALMLNALPNTKRIVASRLLYGSTRTLLEKITSLRGDIELEYAGPPWDELLSAIKGSDLVFIETVGNPTLRIPPIDEIIKICGQEGCTVVVDNTFATPVIYRPVEAGADIVVESMTKYIGGHNDVLGGLLCSNHIKLKESIWEWRKLTGTIIQPLDAYLVARGLKTLHLRVKYSSEAAMEIAKWLADRPEVVKVHYPGLPDHPDHSIASKLFDGLYGGVVSFEIKGGAVAAKKFLNALKTIVPAPSLGGTESIATYPYESSHRNLSEEEKRKLEITPGLIRLSVGLENVEDLIADIENALKTSQS